MTGNVSSAVQAKQTVDVAMGLMLRLDNSSVTLLRLSGTREHVFGICAEVKWLPRGKAITQEK